MSKQTQQEQPVGRPRHVLVRLLPLAVFLLAVSLLFLVHSLGMGEPELTPTTNDGKRWRIGYLQGGPYVEYPIQLRALIGGLVELGWMEPVNLPEAPEGQTREMWQYLVRHARSDYLEFVGDAWWSADWNENRRAEIREKVLQRLNGRGDIDFMIAMGTAAGQDLRDGHNTPTMVMSTSDPVAAGIIDSPENSGRDHLHAECDPDKYVRQAHTFHNIIEFKRLGVVSGESPTAQIYANIPDLRRAAGECGFELLIGYAPESNVSPQDARDAAAAQIAHLAPQVDAFWISDHTGTQPQFLPDIIQPLIAHKVPTWSPLGPKSVRRGVLFGIADQDPMHIGRFNARVMARILNGELPRSIPQICQRPRSLAINRETARRIDFELPPGLLLVADEVYDTIEANGALPHPREEE